MIQKFADNKVSYYLSIVVTSVEKQKFQTYNSGKITTNRVLFYATEMSRNNFLPSCRSAGC